MITGGAIWRLETQTIVPKRHRSQNADILGPNVIKDKFKRRLQTELSKTTTFCHKIRQQLLHNEKCQRIIYDLYTGSYKVLLALIALCISEKES